MGESAFAGPPGARALVSTVTCAVLLGAFAAQWSPAFSSYDSDLWTYLLVAERVADGQDMLRDEPFALVPPPSPQVSLAWIALGEVRRGSGAPALALARGLAVGSLLCLGWGAFVLAGRLFGSGLVRAIAFLLFWTSLPESWSAVVLGRYVSVAFVVLAAAAALDFGRSPRAAAKAGLFIALAFYAHLFGGVLAAGAVVVVVIARWRCREAPGLGPFAQAVLIGALLASPCLLFALRTAGLARTSAHTWRPEQVEALGFLWMRPSQILDLLPLGALLLSVVGLVVPCRPERRLARAIGRVGTFAVLLLLLTPLYQAAVGLFGAWLVARAALLAFPWLTAALALEWIAGDGRSRARFLVAAALVVAIGAEAMGRAARDWTGEAYAFTPAAQDEAMALRATIRGRLFLAPDLMGYGLAAPTLGRPLAVPPGHASPFGDFRRQQRRMHRAFSANTEECWTALFGIYPDAAFLLTPAPGAVVERRIWHERFPGASPEAVRDRLRSLGVLGSTRAGAAFVVDALTPPRPEAGHPARSGGLGIGPRCREEP